MILPDCVRTEFDVSHYWVVVQLATRYPGHGQLGLVFGPKDGSRHSCGLVEALGPRLSPLRLLTLPVLQLSRGLGE